MGLQKAYYAIKIKSFTFYAEKSAHLQPQNKNILTFSADSSKYLCVKKYIFLLFLPIYRLFVHLRRRIF